ncbi:MAG: VOC family protein, partial [Candidatus Izemoplasmataceae bacterium]
MRELKGLHHVTAIASDARKIYDFFTGVLGLRLVKKTVNQDDIETYHLFFADDKGSAGTDMTFFDFPGAVPGKRGTDAIDRVGFRVKDDASLEYWKKRFDHYGIAYEPTLLFGRKAIEFNDFDGSRYALFSDQGIGGVKGGIPWKNGPVPDEHAIIGLGPIFLRVRDVARMEQSLTKHMGMRTVDTKGDSTLYEMGEGGNGASVIVITDEKSPIAMQGYGSVHHVAFRIEDKPELFEWIEHLNKIGARHSGYVDRFYFKSLYSRLYPYILFEFATEGPGFID